MFPIHAAIISLCKGKLFESVQCLRILAARSDVRRLYSLDKMSEINIMLYEQLGELIYDLGYYLGETVLNAN